MDPDIVKQNEELKDLEVLSLRKRVSELESQLEEAKKLIQKHLLETNEVDLLKMRSSDTLTKAKSVIFENTKMIKNQELQIDALNQQVGSLRDVVKITKELLEIRNLEVDQLESKIHCMEEKYKAEKERQDLMHQRLEQMIRHNGDLKREYETQLCLFKALREGYDERELAKGLINNLKSDIDIEKEKKIDQNIAVNQLVQNEMNDQVGETSPTLQNQAEGLQVQDKNVANEQKEQEKNEADEDKTGQGKDVETDKATNQQENDSAEGNNSKEKEEVLNGSVPEEPKNLGIEDIQPNLDSSVVKQ